MADSPTEAADVLVSYARVDRRWVSSLVDRLEAMGWTVWWDQELRGGEEFDERIASQLASARAVIVVWSETSVASSWVKAEANEARERGTLIPVVIDESRPPLPFGQLHTLDLSGWQGDPQDPAYLDLLKAITARSRAALDGPSVATGADRTAGLTSGVRGTTEVGAGIEATDAQIGEVVGEERQGDPSAASSGRVDVLRDAKLERTKIDKITGRSYKQDPDAEDRSEKPD